MSFDNILNLINTTAQVILVIVAFCALFTWKKEAVGKEKHQTAKEYLDYIKEIRFLFFLQNSTHQIYLNDIFNDKNNFYKDQLLGIKDKDFYFTESIFGIFDHINTRSDILLPKKIRELIDGLIPKSAKSIKFDNKINYVEIHGVPLPKISNIDEINSDEKALYKINEMENITIGEYFRKWEKLIKELKKYIYD